MLDALVNASPSHLVFPRVHAEGNEPEYKADSEYPPWVFKLMEDKPLLEDIIMKGVEKVPEEKMQMVFRMASKRQIKADNASRRKE